MNTITVFLKNGQKFTFTGEGYRSPELDEMGSILSVESKEDTDVDMHFNWDEVLYYELRTV